MLEEKYFFKEVHTNFERNKTLTLEEFVAMVVWKSQRRKTKVAGTLKAQKIVEELMKQVAEAREIEKVKLLYHRRHSDPGCFRDSFSVLPGGVYRY